MSVRLTWQLHGSVVCFWAAMKQPPPSSAAVCLENLQQEGWRLYFWCVTSSFLPGTILDMVVCQSFQFWEDLAIDTTHILYKGLPRFGLTLSSPTVRSWWSQWVVSWRASHEWRRWSDTLWVTLTRLWPWSLPHCLPCSGGDFSAMSVMAELLVCPWDCATVSLANFYLFSSSYEFDLLKCLLMLNTCPVILQSLSLVHRLVDDLFCPDLSGLEVCLLPFVCYILFFVPHIPPLSFSFFPPSGFPFCCGRVLACINDLVLPLVSELWQKFNMQASSGYTGLYPLLSTGSWCSQWVSCGRKYAIIHPCYCWWSLNNKWETVTAAVHTACFLQHFNLHDLLYNLECYIIWWLVVCRVLGRYFYSFGLEYTCNFCILLRVIFLSWTLCRKSFFVTLTTFGVGANRETLALWVKLIIVLP